MKKLAKFPSQNNSTPELDKKNNISLDYFKRKPDQF